LVGNGKFRNRPNATLMATKDLRANTAQIQPVKGDRNVYQSFFLPVFPDRHCVGGCDRIHG
jgi:hypothetical protein